jgi:hypothetical protein
MLSQDKFPVPTYKIGRQRVIDRTVLQAYFSDRGSDGMRKLKKIR